MKLFKACLMLTILIPTLAISQNLKQNVGDKYLVNNVEKLELSKSDLNNLIVTDLFRTKHNGVTHIYYQQSRNDIPVINAILNLNITKDDKVLFYNNEFVKDLDAKINTSKSALEPDYAVKALANKLGYTKTENLNILKSFENGITYAATSYSRGEVKVNQKYLKLNENDVRLVWDISLDEKNTANSWNSQIDAVTGQILNHENRTIFCQHAPGHLHNHDAECRNHSSQSTEQEVALESMLTGDSYRVYPLPLESPNHGSQQLITDPFLPAASPFGWHDIDGIEGDEYTYTRGNNVHTYQNEDASGFSKGDEPRGANLNAGALIFDFTHVPNAEPEASFEADAVNLFYSVNMCHDISYIAGFDEAAGNFQLNNFGNGGRDNDYVIAYSLDATPIGNPPATTNNAYFRPQVEGVLSELGMHRWNLPGAGLFEVKEPAELSGTIPNGVGNGGWAFDESYASYDITAELVQAFDASLQFSNNVCGEIINASEVNGKIAMIYRGLCEFGEKALNAQNAGAIAAIICNVPGAGNDPTSDGNDPFGMGPGLDGATVSIPVLSLGFSDCNKIVSSLNQGVTVSATIKQQEDSGPTQYSASFDNVIAAHEYFHGISARLTGGASNVNCLRNDEQMGEGWSDFFALILTVEPGDRGTDQRGIGTYVQGATTEGGGIRRSPYSTDRSINDQTFNDIKATTTAHPLGEIWAATLWDLHWAYVEKYDLDADWTNTESGNFRVLQLVIDGLKIQGCNPGYIRGRDALLAADQANTGGENQCLIWDVFAARGLGYFADGGSDNDRNDNSENFDPLPECQKTLKIYKQVPEIIEVDKEIEITLIVANHKDEMVNAVVSDLIPDGMTYVSGSASDPETLMNDQIFFNIDNFASGAWDTITFNVMHTNTLNSKILTTNSVETGEERNQWERVLIEGETNLFRINNSNTFPNYAGENGWHVQELDENTESGIRFNNIQVTGEFPVVRFWHRINTEFTRNGGFVEISTDGTIWNNAHDLFIRNGPECPIQFTTFAIPALQGFSGRSTEFVDSYIDLSNYKGQSISLRFRFGSNDAGTPNDPADDIVIPEDGGWFLDDIDLIDLVNNESEACISTSIDQACTIAPYIYDPQFVSSTINNTIEGLTMSIFPNPANDYVTIDIFSEKDLDAQISIWSMDGKQALIENHRIDSNKNLIQLNTSQLSSGFYIIQLLTEKGIVSHKIAIQ